MQDIHDSLSSILGWVSIACWIIVFTPQIYENYLFQSGEGLSTTFVVIWLLGDLTNVAGAVLGGLLPTVILLGVYYSLCDCTLLAQIYYYRWKRSQALFSNEREPLLNQPTAELVANSVLLLRYTGALFFVASVGTLAWWIGDGGRQTPMPPQEFRWEVQALGWTSAALYLGARLPQIGRDIPFDPFVIEVLTFHAAKNLKTRCEGLSPALFFFSIFGNVTYALSICAKSIDKKYLITNAGWLAGSLLTVFLDAFVLCQIFYYRATDRSTRALSQ